MPKPSDEVNFLVLTSDGCFTFGGKKEESIEGGNKHNLWGGGGRWDDGGAVASLDKQTQRPRVLPGARGTEREYTHEEVKTKPLVKISTRIGITR